MTELTVSAILEAGKILDSQLKCNEYDISGCIIKTNRSITKEKISAILALGFGGFTNTSKTTVQKH